MIPDIPELPKMEQTESSKPHRIRWYHKYICKVIGHVVNPGDYIDSHGNWDGLSYCERCGEYDV